MGWGWAPSCTLVFALRARGPDKQPIGSRSAWLIVTIFLLLGAGVGGAVDFNRDVAPILVRRCLECHSANEASGGLVLATQAGVQKGGESGPAIADGAWEKSHLWHRLSQGEMPPERNGRSQNLPANELAVLRAWLADGAKWPKNRTLDLYEQTSSVRAGRDWWSLQPIQRPAIPPMTGDAGGNPIDGFIHRQLSKHNFASAPPADKRTLLRRLYNDLIGLPPTLGELEAFAADPAPDAYARRVDQLLASPHFGERWGRYWLDLVRYADTCGYERDQDKPGAWKYRDWVIRSINDDKPYDRFVTEQLAGDELPDRSEQTLVGLGFLRLGTWNDEPNDPDEYKYERLEDMVHATGTAFLGLSLKCARCHDHKFDPIPQVDYYRVANAFWAGPIEPRQRELLGGPTKEELGADVLGWTDIRRTPPPLHLLKKGDPKRPLAAVDHGHLSLVARLDRPVAQAPAGAKTTQRRLQLARWIVDPHNPLTARVYVNRLWQRHFGAGLVRSPNNFGFKGERPTHPELLDWLASELIAGGWRSKPLHRLMVMSQTYQQASVHPDEARQSQVDADNRLWRRAERRRMDAEAMRDAILVASGELDRRMAGPSFKPEISPDALEGLSRKSNAWQPSPSREQNRRSVYMYMQRSLLPPLMTTFDLCDSTEPCGQRDVSIVAPQALALLNNRFLHDQSEKLAAKILHQVGDDPTKQVRLAWRQVLAREPSAAEIQGAIELLADNQRRLAASTPKPKPVAATAPSAEGLTLHISAGKGVEVDAAGGVLRWLDQSAANRQVGQPSPQRRPRLARMDDKPVVRFDGQQTFLAVAGPLLTRRQFTLVAVAADTGPADRAREIISNWNGAAGNSVQSVFLGLTGDSIVRFSDDFANAGRVVDRRRLFVLTAVQSETEAVVFCNGQEIARKDSPLAQRRLDTAWVLGTQGNFGQEFWAGDLAEVLVYDRAIPEPERRSLDSWLMGRHSLAPVESTEPPAAVRALALVCQTLLNTNEFLYVD